MTDTKTMKVTIARFDPDKDEVPRTQDYEVQVQSDWKVLDVINHIKDEIDPTVSHRWSCRMAVCGSCGMMVNGEPHLACKTFLRDYHPNKIRVEPLANFPIERDLVVVMDDFIQKLESIKPYLITKQEKPLEDGEYRQTPAQLVRYQQYSMCINCLLCYSACPQYALNPNFTGPAVLALLHRYNNDSRDAGKNQRMDVASAEEGVWGCTFVGYCSEVCPKQVDPAAAIQQTKIVSTTDYMLSFIMPRGANR